jgi:hypothetical protein
LNLYLRSLLVLVVIMGLAACHGKPSSERMLFDFESQGELDRIHWKCHTLMSLSEEHVSRGSKSLKLELYPSGYPGLAPMISDNDWQMYKALCFDVYNPEQTELRITVRIDDQKDYPEYKDRYNKSFGLKIGMNRLGIPLDTLVTSGTKRQLDLKHIYRFLFFMVDPKEKHTIYVDNVRLTQLGGKSSKLVAHGL